MKTTMKLVLTICVMILTVSCSPDDSPLIDMYQYDQANTTTDNTSDEENYTLEDLQGIWMRTGGNHPGNEGMVIKVENTSGILLDPIDSGFSIDDVKWMSIAEANSVEDFTHQELGSDYSYYEATITFQSDNVIRISVNAGGAGNYQEWTRQ